MFAEIKTYLRKNIYYSIALAFFVLSVLLKSANIIDITLPCLSKSLLDIECPGCGITTACVHIAHGNLAMAYESNFLVFIILPIALVLLVLDYKKFHKSYHIKKLI